MLQAPQPDSPRRLGLVVALASFAIVMALGGLGRLQTTENALLQLRFELRGTRPAGPQVLLVAQEEGGRRIDLPSGQDAAPWSRRRLAALVSRLDRAGASAIGLDLPALAGVAPAESADDELLAEAMRSHGRVVLPMLIREGVSLDGGAAARSVARFAIGSGELERPVGLHPGALAVPSPVLTAAAAGVGATNIYLELDGAAREAPLAVSLDGTIYPALWLELVRVMEGLGPEAVSIEPGRVVLGERSFDANPNLEVLINYVGGYRDFPRISSAAAMEMTIPELRRNVAGRIVLVGTDLAGVTTLLSTPTAPAMPGVEVAATLTENLASDRLLSRPPAWVTPLLTLVLVLLVAAMAVRASALNGLLATALVLLATVLAGLIVFRLGAHLSLAEPLLAVAITGGALAANSSAASERRRAQAEAALQSRLQAIAGIGRLVNSSLDREQLLVEILRWAESEIDAEASSVLMVDPGGQHLRFEVALGEKAGMLKDITVRIGEGIAGTAAATGEPIVSQDVQSDERWSPDVAYAIDYLTRSILCVPMLLRDEVVGVIEIINKRDGPFTEYDVQLMQVIAQQSALFLENARLYRVLSDRVDLANEELRRTNERLRFEMARIATLVDEMADAVVATDGSDRVVIFNNAAERMFGLHARRACGQLVVTLLDQEEICDLFTMPLSPHGGSYETEIALDGGDGIVVRAHIALIDEPGGRSIGKCAVFSDISHLKQLDRMKMDLVSFVSHELKNPIASLQGAWKLLTGRLNIEDERTARLLEIAGRQSRRMQYLVQDFLDLSRIEAGQELSLSRSEIEDVRELVEGSIALCRGAAPERPISVEVDPGTPPLYADRNKIEAVIINLVENALKYSAADAPVSVRVFPGDGETIIAVKDRGTGIRAEDLPKLFRSFQRVHDDSYGQVSGTGVGLYICRHIMQAHGGEVTVESTWGEGSTFSLHLPWEDRQREERPPDD
ncbi:MAG: CHASE2 domain-containing protein [Armatimonadota bacterium]|jgi:PAS domain S-box-containing protein